MPTVDDIAQQKTLLQIHRRNLAHYLKQAGFHGAGNVPLGTLNGIDSERGEIRRIKSILRGWNQSVDDHVDDEEVSATTATALPSQHIQLPQPPSSIPTQQQSPDSAFTYDVFISYSHHDEQWVEDTLLKILEDAGLRVCIDFRDFLPGKPAIANMEDSVAKSKHTLIVLTPAWLASEWSNFEGLLAQTNDPAGLRRRLIPLRLQPVEQLPGRISMLTWVDFTRPERQQIAWTRLIKALQEPVA